MATKVKIKYTEEYPDLPDQLIGVDEIEVTSDNTVIVYGDCYKFVVHPDHWVTITEITEE